MDVGTINNYGQFADFAFPDKTIARILPINRLARIVKLFRFDQRDQIDDRSN